MVSGMSGLIAIVGRPNVGKSALFNRITGTNDAIVADVPGVTRDRRYTRALWGGRELMLIDTGGLMQLPGEAAGATKLTKLERAALAGGADVLPGMIEQQAAAAVAEADALIVVTDGQAGLTTADADIVTWLRRKYPDKRCVLAVNKCESPVKGAAQAAAFWELGVEPTAVRHMRVCLDALSCFLILMRFFVEPGVCHFVYRGRRAAGQAAGGAATAAERGGHRRGRRRTERTTARAFCGRARAANTCVGSGGTCVRALTQAPYSSSCAHAASCASRLWVARTWASPAS